jgi:hypothetical protein
VKLRVLVVGVLLIVSACGREASTPKGMFARQTAAAPEAASEVRMAMAAPPAPQAPAGGAGAAAAAGQVPVPAERKIIRNGSLELEIKALDEALTRIRTETEKTGGYVTNESQGKDEYDVRHGSITCRLPAGKLDSVLQLFQSLGRVESVNVTAEDITEQYFNLEIRLRNQRQLEERFIRLLDKPGNKVTDLLEVEREVARVRGEIDELEGRKRFWDSQVAFSTLTVQLHEPRPVIAGEGGGVWDTLKTALRDAGENLVGTIAWFIAALGVILPAWLVLWILWRLWKALRARRKPRT